jgi:hypothetical protein
MEYGFQGCSFARKICCRENTHKALAYKGFSNFINRLSERLGLTIITFLHYLNQLLFDAPGIVVGNTQLAIS